MYNIRNTCTACLITCCKTNKKKIEKQRYRTVKMPNIKAIALICEFARSRAFILKCDRMPESDQISDYKTMLFSNSSFVVEVMSCSKCRDEEESLRGSILYSILNRGAPRRGTQLETAAAHRHLCYCASASKLVTIRAPLLMFTAASQVLAKTFRFLKNVACFRGLPTGDQLLLVRHSWAPLLVVGLVQDSVHFDTVEMRRPSLLHAILTHRREDTSAGTEDPGVPVGVAEGIQMFLVRCSGLRMSVKEFALVKGAILFTPGRSQRATALLSPNFVLF